MELAQSHGAELIICVLIMPNVDGFEVVAQLQDAASTASIRILAGPPTR